MQNAGVRSLVQARLFGSTSRLLDIGRLIDRFDEAGGPSRAVRPFEHGPLNSAMIIKNGAPWRPKLEPERFARATARPHPGPGPGEERRPGRA